MSKKKEYGPYEAPRWQKPPVFEYTGEKVEMTPEMEQKAKEDLLNFYENWKKKRDEGE